MDISIKAELIKAFHAALLESGKELLVGFSLDRTFEQVSDLSQTTENKLKDTILQCFPAAIIFGKHDNQPQVSSLSSNELIWIINPLDGISNFISGVPHFSLSTAVFVAGKLQAAAVYDPIRDELFMAFAGEGATCNQHQISTSRQKDFHQSLIAIDFSPKQSERERLHLYTYREVLRHCQAARHFGATALDVCWVASGRLDAMLILDCMPWDVAASSLILAEANGCAANFTSHTQDELDIFGESFAFSNPYLHFALLDFAKKGHRAALDAI